MGACLAAKDPVLVLHRQHIDLIDVQEVRRSRGTSRGHPRQSRTGRETDTCAVGRHRSSPARTSRRPAAAVASASARCVVNVAIPHWRGRWLPRMASLFIPGAGVVSMTKHSFATTCRRHGDSNRAMVGGPARDGCSLLNSRGSREAASMRHADRDCGNLPPRCTSGVEPLPPAAAEGMGARRAPATRPLPAGARAGHQLDVSRLRPAGLDRGHAHPFDALSG